MRIIEGVLLFAAVNPQQKGIGELVFTDGSEDPYRLFLELTWYRERAVSSDFTVQKRKCPLCRYLVNRLGSR
jgi:hypothetical protein